MAQRKRVEHEPVSRETTAKDASQASAFALSEAWIGGQLLLLERLDEVGKGWMQRRRAALEAAQQSLTESFATRDPLDLIRIQQEWVSGAWQRVASDLEALTRLTFYLAMEAITRAPAAAEERRSIREVVLSAAGDKPAAARPAAE